jgi:membrane protease YdiL (CAAX protease family)
MKPLSLFINPDSRVLRGGWRLAIFIALITLPGAIGSLIVNSGTGSIPQPPSVNAGTIIFYFIMIGWTIFVSWLCLRLIEQLPLGALGCFPHRNWGSHLLLGIVISGLMISSVVLIEGIGGMRLGLNSMLSWSAMGNEIAASLILFILAAAFEELQFRGYPLQTLLRSLPTLVPVVLFATLFGLAHLANPNHTKLATINTALAGIWLGVAYLKTRSLWFPTALHFSWNWTMGAIYGLPVSGLRLPSQSLLVASDSGPEWLTGGSYGPEGGLAASIVLIIATLFIWQTRWLSAAEQTQETLTPQTPQSLDLH